MTTLLQRKDVVPHFVVRTVDGQIVRYADVWQKQFLVLVCVAGPDEVSADYVAAVRQQCAALDVSTACLVTADIVPGVPRPGALVADRFGEIGFVGGAASVRELPSADDLVEWVRYLSIRCS